MKLIKEMLISEDIKNKDRMIWDDCTPTLDRRPTTVDDIENDIHVQDFGNPGEILEFLEDLAGTDAVGDTYEEKLEDILTYFEDSGDGSPNILYLSINGQEVGGTYVYDCIKHLDLSTVTEEEVKQAMLAELAESKPLSEDINDGWELEDTESGLLDVIGDLERVAYELKNCIRGAYTRCTTYKELSMYLKKRAEELDYEADALLSLDDSLTEDVEESNKNVINLNKFIDFIADHKTAREDFIRYFNIEEVDGEISADGLNQEEVADWLADHEQLKDDYDRYLKSKEDDELNEDVETILNKDLVGKKVKCKKGYTHPNMGKEFVKGRTYTITEKNGRFFIGDVLVSEDFFKEHFTLQSLDEDINDQSMDISDIKSFIENLKVKYDLKAEDLYNNGAIYYMNANDGTDFDYQANGRTCEFFVFFKDEVGAIKCFVDEDDICAYVYDKEDAWDSSKSKYETTSSKFDLYSLCRYLQGSFDDKNKYDTEVTNWTLTESSYFKNDDEDDFDDDINESLNENKEYEIYRAVDNNPDNLELVDKASNIVTAFDIMMDTSNEYGEDTFVKEPNKEDLLDQDEFADKVLEYGKYLMRKEKTTSLDKVELSELSTIKNFF